MTAQHMDALARANDIRSARSAMKREVKAGERKVSELLREHAVPDWLSSMLVEDLLNVTPHFRSKLGREMILTIPARATATVGELTLRKRRILADKVAEWESRRGQKSYEPGSTPEAPDWDGGSQECGGGLHFSPHPKMAKEFNGDPKHYVACPVLVSEIAVHPDGRYPQKVKAPRCCAPVWEVDQNCNRVEAV